MPGKAFRIEEEKQCELKAFVGGQQFLTCTLISKLISHDFLFSLSLFDSILYFCFWVNRNRRRQRGGCAIFSHYASFRSHLQVKLKVEAVWSGVGRELGEARRLESRQGLCNRQVAQRSDNSTPTSMAMPIRSRNGN